MPWFVLGVALADLECSEYKTFNKLRELDIWWKIPINTVLFVLFVIYGSNANRNYTHCYTEYDEQCPFYKVVTFDNFI
jgi:hypothetical protein